MRGGAAVAQVYSDLIVQRTPEMLARLAVEQGGPVPGSDLALVAPGQRAADQIRLEDWPFVLVVPQRTESIAPDTVSGDGSMTYRVTYRLRIFVWARGNGFIETDLARHRLTLAVLETLLAYPQPQSHLRTDPTTVVTDYSDVVNDEALASTIAAASVDLAVTAHEALTPVRPSSTATDVTVAADTLPPV